MRPFSTTTVWFARKVLPSASNTRTFVNATAPAGCLTSDFVSAGICAASATLCASLRWACSETYCSGSQLRKNTKPKNLPFASDHTGIGELLTPVMAQAVTSCAVAPEPTVTVVSFSALALPPGSRSRVLSGRARMASRNTAVCSIGPPVAE